jgi:hypothetical protein
MLAPPEKEPEGPLWQRLVWMLGIWAASVAVLGVVAYIIRLWIAP